MSDELQDDSVETAPAAEPDAPEPDAGAPAEEEQAQPEPAPAAAEAPEAPADNTIVVQGQHPKDDNDHDLFEQDLKRGHIKAETYQSLYGQKDTLGKIGTLFGLLVSGMGSGLTGQPNAVLAMMDNQIKNDLESQRLSNDNAQNWLRLSQAHQRQKAEVAQMGATTENMRARTGAIPSEIKRNEAAADLESMNAALIRERIATSHYLEHKVIAPMPAGPNKDNATKVFKEQVEPAIKQENAVDTAKTKAKVAAITALSATSAPAKAKGGDDFKGVDTVRIQRLRDAGKAAEGLGGSAPPGTISHDQYPTVIQEAKKYNTDLAVYKTLRASFEKLNQQAIGGAADRSQYNTLMNHAKAQLESAGLSKDSAEELAASSLPSWKDMFSPEGIETKAQQLHEQYSNKAAGAITLSGLGLLPAFPGPPKISKDTEKQKVQKAVGSALGGKKSPGAPKEGSTSMSGGKPIVYRNGKWTAK